MKAWLFVLVLLLWTVSCAPFSQEVMQEVKKDIEFSDVVRNPEAFRGESVIWGGVIIETIARPSDTLILVRQTELDFQKQPKDPDRSAGRFIVRYSGFLDPAIYGKDREITVVGTVAGKEDRLVGERRYSYPVVDVRDLRLWEKRMDPPYYYDPWYGGPYPYPWRPYPWRPHPYWW
ncbi:MAG TPA: Slp family lipoprotein [Syntrophales bacterium]|jgi:outer membrane lipoprotein|nr:Slp family lipoprotein [Syntrophales bacterium]HRT63080.1 Slp family lipoprotein [Syntrophales bacterium]